MTPQFGIGSAGVSHKALLCYLIYLIISYLAVFVSACVALHLSRNFDPDCARWNWNATACNEASLPPLRNICGWSGHFCTKLYGAGITFEQVVLLLCLIFSSSAVCFQLIGLCCIFELVTENQEQQEARAEEWDQQVHRHTLAALFTDFICSFALMSYSLHLARIGGLRPEIGSLVYPRALNTAIVVLCVTGLVCRALGFLRLRKPARQVLNRLEPLPAFDEDD